MTLSDLLFILSGPAVVLAAGLAAYFLAVRDSDRARNAPGE
ncbi:MAG TPA: hypothetical protein VIL65_17630 [Beijerinckiaceae bacterium]|jgi:hypothetical protein